MKQFHPTLSVLFSLFLGICTFSSCADRNDAPPSEPEEKGQFKIVFSSSASKTFFEDLTAGEECEKALKKLTMFVYENGSDTYVYQRAFTTHEVDKKSAIFSIGDIDPAKSYDFYVVANYTFKPSDAADIQKVTRTELLALLQSDISTYNAPTFAEMFNNGTAKGMRTDGFVMSGTTQNVAPPATDTPRQVTVNLDRIVAKIAMRTTLSDAFKTNYISKYGSTMEIQSATISALPNNVKLVVESGAFTAPGNFNTTLAQTPTVNVTETSYDNLFYTFPNGKLVNDVGNNKPTLTIVGKYDFDGNPATTLDASTITYTTKLESLTGTQGLLPRNGYIKVVVNINGLTESEVKAEIKVNEWQGVITETIDFGG